MNEDIQPTPPAAPPKRKYQRRRRLKPAARSAAPPKKVEQGDLVGLTATECCDACYEAGSCVITDGHCGHPFKGGLHSADQMKPDVVRKYARAKKMLQHQKVEARSQ